jgi:hypothetical protein
MRVDLRHTAFPARGAVWLTVRAGARRTIVALPHDRCVHVRVHRRGMPFVARVAGAVAGRSTNPFVSTFGNYTFPGYVNDAPVLGRRGRRTPGPTLNITFKSGGGSLYVRDYPDDVNPDLAPDWPGERVYPEHKPNITGTPKRAARRLIRHWRVRHRAQVRSARRVNSAIPGPCAAKRVSS